MAKAAVPSISRIREAFRYSEGRLFWRINGVGKKLGAEAGTSKTNKGYYQVCLDRCVMLSHRVIWALIHGKWPEDQLDHISRDKEDNRISNLREASCLQNNGNKLLRRDSTTKVIGVTFCKRRAKFVAQIKIEGRHKHLGCYDSAVEAGAAYAGAALNKYGEFFPLNIPGPQE